MARRWESKSVEAQIESAEDRHRRIQASPANLAENAFQQQKQSIELSRARVLHDIETAQNPKYREVLGRSLAFLDAKLAELEKQRANH